MKKLLWFILAATAFAQNPTYVARMLSGVNYQTGTTYTFVAQDSTRIVAFNSPNPVSATIPAGTTTNGFGAGTMFSMMNIGAGTVTLNCGGCVINLNGAQFAINLQQGQGADLFSDGTNYAAEPGGGGGTAGTTNPALQFSVPYYCNPGTSNFLCGLNGPTATSGVPYQLIEIPAAGAATAPTFSLAGVQPNAQTGTSYTIQATDRLKYLSFSNGSSIAVTLPQAGTAGFANNFAFTTCDIGSGTATFTPTTSTISYSTGSGYTSGATTLALSTGQCAFVYTDNTNYFANTNKAATGGTGTVTSLATASPITGGTITTTGTIACATCAIGPGSSTANHIAEFSGTDGVTLKDGGAAPAGTVSSVGFTVNSTSPSGIFTVTGSPVTTSGTLNINLAGTSGGVPYFSSGTVVSAGGILNTNILTKGGGAGAAPTNSQVTDDGTNPVKSPNGYDVSTAGGYDYEIANNASTGTTALTATCDDGAGKAIVCPHTSSTANQPLGFLVSGAGTTGNATLCNLGWCQVKFDNSTTARHYAIASTTTDGQLHDNGASIVAGQPNYFIVTANGGAGNAGYVRLLTADDFNNATVSIYKVQVNGTTLTAGDTVNLNATTPAAGSNGINVTWQTSKSGTTDSVSAEVVGNGNSYQFLNGTSAYSNLFVTNAQTSTYQVVAADFAGCKTIPVASGTFTITLVASGSQPTTGQCIDIVNYGTGVVTVARSGQNINGGTTSITIAAGSQSAPNGLHVVSDGTNYIAQPWGAGGGGGSPTATVNLRPDECHPSQNSNAGNTYWSPAITWSNNSGDGPALLAWTKNTAADWWCSLTVPTNLSGTSGSIILQFSANDNVSGHTDVFNISDVITSSNNPNVAATTDSSTCTFTTTTTAYAATTCTFSIHATLAANQLLAFKVHQAASASVANDVVAPYPVVQITESF